MKWWVYEDDATSWVRVHRATCSHCNDGRGRYGTRRPDNRWHGPFRTRQEAIDRALSTGERVKRTTLATGMRLPLISR